MAQQKRTTTRERPTKAPLTFLVTKLHTVNYSIFYIIGVIVVIVVVLKLLGLF